MNKLVILTTATAKDPVCGMEVNPATAKAKAEHAGQTYYFCCPHCAQKFTAEPQKYLAKPVSESTATVKDPVCGMNVDPATAKAKAEHAGQTYYFCCPHCAQKFTAEPQKYLG